MKRFILIACFFFVAQFGFGQRAVGHNIMIIPFEPKLYMSQVDHKFNTETKLTQKQIREIFRKGINSELRSVLQKNKKLIEVTDLMKDTTKYKKDLISIYKNVTYTYDKVPDQTDYKPPVNDKTKNETIKKGQLVVETDPAARFMNAKVINPSLVPSLFAKYKTDIFLFINQLDITSTSVGTGATGDLTERTITIHYTVYTVNAREIQSGLCSVKFTPEANNPAKVVTAYGSKIAAEISRRLSIAITKEDKRLLNK